MSNEILMASESGCPIEMHRIKIEKCDEMYDRDCKGGRTMPFHRAIYDPRTGQSPNLPREQVRNISLHSLHISLHSLYNSLHSLHISIHYISITLNISQLSCSTLLTY